MLILCKLESILTEYLGTKTGKEVIYNEKNMGSSFNGRIKHQHNS